MQRRHAIAIWMLASLAGLTGCGNQPKPEIAAAAGPDQSLAAKLRSAIRFEADIPAGTELEVRLNQAVGSALSHPGEPFEATLDAAIVEDEKVLIPKGASLKGRVTQAVPSGRLRTPGRLAVTLDTLVWKGESYKIHTTTVSRAASSHKNHNLGFIGGGSTGGALIGGLAGGGAGALIGAGAGAAAGTAGAFVTGKKNIVIPAEARLRFRLEEPVKIRM